MNVLCFCLVLVFYVLLVLFCSFSALILQFCFVLFCEVLLLYYCCFFSFSVSFFFKREIIKLDKEDLGGVEREVRVGSKYSA